MQEINGINLREIGKFFNFAIVINELTQYNESFQKKNI